MARWIKGDEGLSFDALASELKGAYLSVDDASEEEQAERLGEVTANTLDTEEIDDEREAFAQAVGFGYVKREHEAPFRRGFAAERQRQASMIGFLDALYEKRGAEPSNVIPLFGHRESREVS